jgi:hypothetical protein
MLRVLLVMGLFLYAQNVGIGTATPDPSARLHIEDTQRGLLIPRIALSARNISAPISTPAIGLLVYNTATAGALPFHVWPGFYYWNGTEWVRLLIYPNEAWQIEGNWGTNPAIHFLGTIDNQPLRIRVNNQQTLQLNTHFSIQRDAGGNARGTDAVDWQRIRTNAAQVASGNTSVIGGGAENTASGVGSVVGGGQQNTAEGLASVVAGGTQNVAQGLGATVGGGSQDTIYAPAVNGVIAGGALNAIRQGNYNSLVGGLRNAIEGDTSFIGGGVRNFIGANVYTAFIGGGSRNTIERTVAGGGSVQGSIIVGGIGNRLTGYPNWAFIGGGRDNYVETELSIICGGTGNRIDISSPRTSGLNVIVGGIDNICRNYELQFIGGGAYNHNESWGSVIVGGQENRIYSADFVNVNFFNFIGGGAQNEIDEASFSGIVGGGGNSIREFASESFIVGSGDTIRGGYGSIALGIVNVMNNCTGSLVMGQLNTLSNSQYAYIFGRGVSPVSENYRFYLFGPGSATSPSGFLVINRLDGDYPIHVGTNGTNGNGAYLSAGGTWTDVSSRSCKEDFQELNPHEILDKVRRLWVGGWKYRGTEEYHIGPMAEDFHALFGTGKENPYGLSAKDQAGVLFLAVKALAERNARLEAEVQELRARLTDVEYRLRQMEQLVGTYTSK